MTSTLHVVDLDHIDKTDYDDNEQQTHNETSRLRNMAVLLILATWTLGDCIAPEEMITVIVMNYFRFYLMALMGKNLPLTPSLLVILKNGRVQIK